jgi:hypothetical protein
MKESSARMAEPAQRAEARQAEAEEAEEAGLSGLPPRISRNKACSAEPLRLLSK